MGVGARLTGWAVAGFVLWLVMTLEGGHPLILLQLPVFLMMTGFTLGGLLAAHGPRRVLRLVRLAVRPATLESADADELIQVCRRGYRLAYAAGVIQVIFGVIHVLSVLGDPGLVGPGIAYGLVGIVHAALLAELGFGAAEQWARAARRGAFAAEAHE